MFCQQQRITVKAKKRSWKPWGGKTGEWDVGVVRKLWHVLEICMPRPVCTRRRDPRRSSAPSSVWSAGSKGAQSERDPGVWPLLQTKRICKWWLMGLTWPADSLCVAHKLKIVFTFLKYKRRKMVRRKWRRRREGGGGREGEETKMTLCGL